MDITILALGKAAILGVVEGITEFLPISSTGHLIIVGDLIGFGNGSGGVSEATAKTFEIFIQLGSILSVVWLYKKKIFDFSSGWILFWKKVFVSFLPTAVVGLALHSYIKSHLFTPYVVAISLIVGGVVILGVEKYVGKSAKSSADSDVRKINFVQAFIIGVAQVLALIPGVSRSGATIMGAMMQKIDRKTAAEYSFFLALPTMVAATGFDLFKSRADIHSSDALLMTVGFVVAFFSALVAIRGFIQFISSHSFRGFAWYRIIFGTLILGSLYFL